MMDGTLRRRGILGMNERNAEFLGPYNPAANLLKVDDKILAKQLARRARLPVPETFAVVSRFGDVAQLGEGLPTSPDFVLKPARGSMGNGVLVVAARDGHHFVQANGRRLALEDLRHHVANTLAGMHSLGGRPDRVIIEERLQVHPGLVDFATDGVPDVRVIVFRGVPLMAMLRLPTKRSGGRANLHQGAIAAGLDLALGTSTRATIGSERVRRHPDTQAILEGITVPDWERVLVMAAVAGDAFGLGYLGLDVVIDRRYGAVFLEANARPGLGIQIANGAGLTPRLRALAGMNEVPTSAEERAACGVRLAAAHSQVR